MKNGSVRFKYYLNQLQVLLTKASKQKNPGLWLYQNNARTPMFMLEGLSKLYAGMHNKKKFSKIKEHAKLLEDTLGAIDYYDSFAKKFAGNKAIPAAIVNYLQAQAREKTQSLNEILAEKEWLGEKSKRIAKISSKLKDAGWLDAKDEVKTMKKFYEKAIAEIIAFATAEDFHFDNVEADVHELRRKLRWLSIYPQAMQGCIQLVKTKPAAKHLNKYLTPEIVNSPFNKLPDAGSNTHFLLLDQNRFLSLSWMIAELGKLKDNGLGIIAIKEALEQTSGLSEKQAQAKAYKLTGSKQLSLNTILKNADAICAIYFKEKNLEQLIAATAALS